MISTFNAKNKLDCLIVSEYKVLTVACLFYKAESMKNEELEVEQRLEPVESTIPYDPILIRIRSANANIRKSVY